MHSSTSNYPKPRFIFATASLIIALLGSGIAQAQDALVVSPGQAEEIKLQTDVNLPDDWIAVNPDGAQKTLVKSQSKSYIRDKAAPALTEYSQNTNLTVGVLSSNSDLDGGEPYRDPFDVDKTEISPIYPEGIYVDYMRADAGINLTSKF